jgi:hypothetical protein
LPTVGLKSRSRPVYTRGVGPDVLPLLTKIREALLRLHKTLLDWERSNFERTHGRQSTTDLLNAFLQDPHFAWLRPMSQLIVRIDEMLENATPPTASDAQSVVTHLKTLTAPGERGGEDARRYEQALQENPDTVFAHRDLMTLLGVSRQDERRESE